MEATLLSEALGTCPKTDGMRCAWAKPRAAHNSISSTKSFHACFFTFRSLGFFA